MTSPTFLRLPGAAVPVVVAALALLSSGCGGGGDGGDGGGVGGGVGGGSGSGVEAGPVVSVTTATVRGTITSDPAHSQVIVDGVVAPLIGSTWERTLALDPASRTRQVVVQLRINGVPTAERVVRIGPPPTP